MGARETEEAAEDPPECKAGVPNISRADIRRGCFASADEEPAWSKPARERSLVARVETDGRLCGVAISGEPEERNAQLTSLIKM